VSRFEAWALPPGFEPPDVSDRGRGTDRNPGVGAAEDGGGMLVVRFDEAGASMLLDRLYQSGELLARRGVRELATILGQVGARFLDPRDELRREAEARLPAEAGLGSAMARRVIEGMARDWSEERLHRLLEEEFEDPEVLDGLRTSRTGRHIAATGGHMAFHLGAGNVPGVGTTSLLRSLLVKCPLVLKPGRGDVTLSVLFARGLAEVDTAVAGSLAVIYWPRESPDALARQLLTRADRVVAYGGSRVVAELRSQLPATTPLVAYHHRVSMGAVSREALMNASEARRIADAAARAVTLFEGHGCVSPRMIWIEKGGAIAPEEWAAMLAECLAALHVDWPPASPTPADAAETRLMREAAEMRIAAAGVGKLIGDPGLSWTVLLEPGEPRLEVSPGRTVHLHPLESLEELPLRLKPLSSVLQTLALEAPEPRKRALAQALQRSGLTRVTTFASQPWPPSWWLHDGSGPLRSLVRWIEVEP